MKYTNVAATARVDFELEDAPATQVPFDRNNTEFIPTFCVVAIALDDTKGTQATKVEVSGLRILADGKPGRAKEHYVWMLGASPLGERRDAPPPHVQELVDAALDIVGRQTVGTPDE